MVLVPEDIFNEWTSDEFDHSLEEWERQEEERRRQEEAERQAAAEAEQREYERWLDEIEAERAEIAAQAEAAYEPPPVEAWAPEPEPSPPYENIGWTSWQNQAPTASIYDARSGGTLTQPTQTMPYDWREQQQAWEQFRDQPAPVQQWEPEPPPRPEPVGSAIDLSSREAFFRTAGPYAQRIQEETGIPANIMLGIAVNEGALARGTVASQYNNLFGIKASPGYQGPTSPVINAWEVIGGRNTTQPSRFRAYASPEESFRDFARFLHENPRYGQALQQTGNPEAFIRALHRAGYATDPNWSNQVLNIARQVPAPTPPPPPPPPPPEPEEASMVRAASLPTDDEGDYVTFGGMRYPVMAQAGGDWATDINFGAQGIAEPEPEPFIGPPMPEGFEPVAQPQQWPEELGPPAPPPPEQWPEVLGPQVPEDFVFPEPAPQQEIQERGNIPSVNAPGTVGNPDLVPNQFASGLSTAAAAAACGPAAAVAFARAYGRNPTMEEALALARQNGWTEAGGMNGAANQARLLNAMGIPNRLEGTLNEAAVIRDIQGGNPVTISTPNHYFVADAYNPQTGQYHVGNSGTVYRQGATWMTLAQIRSIGGGINGVLYLDNPASPVPSVATIEGNTSENREVITGPATREALQGLNLPTRETEAPQVPENEEALYRQWAEEAVANLEGPAEPQTFWDQAGQTLGGAANAVGNAAWNLGSVEVPVPGGQTNLREIVGAAAGPLTGAARAGMAEDVIASETQAEWNALQQAITDYGYEDPRTLAAADAYNAAAARSRGEDTGFRAAERHPAFGASELATGLASAALAYPVAPSASAGVARNLAGLAIDPTNALGLAGEGVGAAARGLRGLGEARQFGEVARALTDEPGFASLPFGRATGTPPPGVSQNTADFYQMDAPKQGQREGLVEWVQHNLDPRDSFPRIRDIEDQILQATGPAGPRPHSRATQLPGVVMETDQILKAELNPILQANSRAGNTLDDLNAFMRARQTEELAARGFQTPGGKTAAGAQQALQDMEQTLGPQRFQALEQAEQALQDFQFRTSLEPSRGGFLTDTQIQDFLRTNQHYFPHEVLDFTAREGGNFTSGSRSVNMAEQQFRGRVGSERDIAAPLEAIVNKTYRIRYAVERNRAADDLIEGLQQVSPSIISRQSGSAHPPGGMGTISRFKNGEKETWFVPAELASEVKQVDAQQANAIVRGIGKINEVSRGAFTTFNPEFIFRNPIRDALDAFYREGQVPLGYHHLRGIYSAITQDAGFDEYAKSHAGIGGLFESQRGQGAKTFEELIRSPEGQMIRTAANPLALIRRINEVLEQGSSIGVYMAQSGKWEGPHLPGPLRGAIGEPTVDAITAAARTRERGVDFNNGHNLVRAANPIVLFLNANVKGAFNAFEPLARGGKNISDARRARAVVRLGVLATAASAAYAYNQQFGDLYERIPKFDRENNIVLINPFAPVGTDERGREVVSYIGIPKPTIVKVLWNVAEDVLRYTQQNKPRRFDEIARSLVGAVTPWSSPVDIATLGAIPAASAVVGAASNFDTFRMAPIETEGMEGQPVQERAAANTSEVAQALAQTGAAQHLGLSPVKLDYMAGEILGGTGRTVTRGIDELGRRAGVFPSARGQPASPNVQLARTPGIRGIMRAGSNEQTEQFDQLAQRMRQVDVEVMEQLRGDRRYLQASPEEQARMQRSARARREKEIRAELGITAPRASDQPWRWVNKQTGEVVQNLRLEQQLTRYFDMVETDKPITPEQRQLLLQYGPTPDYQRWYDARANTREEWGDEQRIQRERMEQIRRLQGVGR